MSVFQSPSTRRLIERALTEDAAHEDPSARVFGRNHRSTARIVAKESTVVAGLPIVAELYEILGGETDWSLETVEGERVEPGTTVARGDGRTAALLKGERAALNFLQRLCGIATRTAAFVEAAGPDGPTVVDTRKTLPGFRHLDKYAVRCGGGRNHRRDLSGGVIVKENHIEAAGGVEPAVARIRDEAPHTVRIEVEAETHEEALRAVDAGADAVMLDNMSADEMEPIVAEIRRSADGGVVVEASGDVTLDRLPELAAIDLDVVSVGALTHSVDATDLSMRLEAVDR
ncbi:MAG: carboxylating nicotinate-nucleotide diphosphorylase [Bradymonadaceae bacterium]